MPLVETLYERLPASRKLQVYNAFYQAYLVDRGIQETADGLSARTLYSLGGTLVAAMLGIIVINQGLTAPSTAEASSIPEPPTLPNTPAATQSTEPQTFNTVFSSEMTHPAGSILVNADVPASAAPVPPKPEKPQDPPKPNLSKEVEEIPSELIALPNYIKLKPGSSISLEVEEYETSAIGRKPEGWQVREIAEPIVRRNKVKVPEWGITNGELDQKAMPVGWKAMLEPLEIIQTYKWAQEAKNKEVSKNV